MEEEDRAPEPRGSTWRPASTTASCTSRRCRPAGGDVATLWALDAATGRARWTWEEVPASLWGHPFVNGGGGLWHPPAFDDDGGLYVAIANPVPWPGTEERPWGRSRPGPNRWNNSIVKLDARTGRFLWGRQVLPHDLYDWDLAVPADPRARRRPADRYDRRQDGLRVRVRRGDRPDAVEALGRDPQRPRRRQPARDGRRIRPAQVRRAHLPGRLGRRADADGLGRRHALRAGQQPLRDIPRATVPSSRTPPRAPARWSRSTWRPER